MVEIKAESVRMRVVTVLQPDGVVMEGKARSHLKDKACMERALFSRPELNHLISSLLYRTSTIQIANPGPPTDISTSLHSAIGHSEFYQSARKYRYTTSRQGRSDQKKPGSPMKTNNSRLIDRELVLQQHRHRQYWFSWSSLVSPFPSGS